MSTKIFNGYRIKASNLTEVVELINSRKKLVADLYSAKCLEEATTNSINVLVHYLLEGKSSKESASSILNKAVDKSETERLPEMVLYPQKVRKHFLLLAYNIDMDKSYPEAQEHNYWNNTDKPDDMPSRVWRERSKDWDKVMPSYTPAIDGLTIGYTLPGVKYFCMVPEERDSIVEAVIDSYDLKLDDKIIRNMTDNVTDNRYLVMQRLREGKFSPEERAQYEQLERHMKSLLPNKIEASMLRQEIDAVRAIVLTQEEKRVLTTELQAGSGSSVLKI